MPKNFSDLSPEERKKVLESAGRVMGVKDTSGIEESINDGTFGPQFFRGVQGRPTAFTPAESPKPAANKPAREAKASLS